MDIYELRIRALRQAMGGISQKDFANQHSLDASYLSQLLNGHRKLGEKAARTLESKAGLPPGSLVAPDGVSAVQSSAAAIAVRGTSYATPVAVAIIAKAIHEGKLNASDVEELRRLAIHLIKKNEASAGSATAVPAQLDGLVDAVLEGAESGENVDDMLKMVAHGMKKSQPKEGSKPNEVSKKKRSN
ncbi:multiprotein-bridging factor 1 family protein [Pseudomonas sp. PLMAX]|jgi:urease gamma subunit|uniref:helix-turn-helix domain-containing protein n=1 Tax=Pseudomonas sp. PLMAX TaxID=2201998 RepID=UPI0038B91C1A